ncbi:aromatic prenyltransferase [Lecanosticta acicola]|uniref:Aromatic prenyltransferase n=1 Tax=Lecanosticta acicola TaxID=111012 RepID=A0AAI8YY95_9PEZI|nr:aromatic prenyltransferase [Lecanosticta acicola]
MAELKSQNEDHKFWADLLLPKFRRYITEIGAYTPEQQDEHVKFFDSLLPHLGPRLPHPHTKAVLTVANMPLGFSVNLSDARKPIARMEIEPLDATSGSAEDPFAAKCIPACFTTLVNGMTTPVDTRWAHQLRVAFTPTAEESAIAKPRLRPGIQRISLAYFGITFDGDNRAMKYCTSHLPKFFGTVSAESNNATNSDAFLFSAVRRLEPGGEALSPSLDAIQHYFQNEKHAKLPSPILFAGLDCIDPSRARVKMYGRTHTTAFSNVRNIMTLGGRAVTEETTEFLARLRSIWHLLLNDPKFKDDEDYDRPPLDPNTQRTGLLVSFEVSALVPTPDIKIYVPFWQYHETDVQAIHNLEQVFSLLGWDWGSGKYGDLLRKTFVGTDLAATQNHDYVSFNYSKKQGSYMTTYHVPPPPSSTTA